MTKTHQKNSFYFVGPKVMNKYSNILVIPGNCNDVQCSCHIIALIIIPVNLIKILIRRMYSVKLFEVLLV